ncbi:hypothetical protein QFC20_006495 [Naganishia adeliensis]|uniref:Uncharacterized protein n=1 Tax=Naganishia adeliensis TaxID=92952 RepID=A0ACC2VB23_9TREE|nr:hypothetical protein QFC20_006495 [Naganishia adeliensis]
MVKKSKGGKKGSKAKQEQEDGSRLPIDIIVVIAEHLVGQHAFGTTANLSLACRMVHRETLPVLYETVSLFSFGRFDILTNPGFKYTKYIFDQPETQHFGLHLPNIVLQIDVDCSPTRPHGDACVIVVYKPVSTATLFTILETPFAHEPFPHDKCGQDPYARLQTSVSEIAQSLSSMSVNPILTEECREEGEKPRIRPVDAISRFDIGEGAYLHGRAPTHLQGNTYNLSFYNAGTPPTDDPYRAVEEVVPSILALFKLATMQPRRSRLAELETAMLSRHDCRWGGKLNCAHIRDYVHRHFKLYFDVPTMKAFIPKFKQQAEATPEILQYRLEIELSGAKSIDDVRQVIDQLLPIYTANLTSPDLVLPMSPRIAELRPHVLEIEAELDDGKLVKGDVNVLVEGGRVVVTTEISDLSEFDDDFGFEG